MSTGQIEYLYPLSFRPSPAMVADVPVVFFYFRPLLTGSRARNFTYFLRNGLSGEGSFSFPRFLCSAGALLLGFLESFSDSLLDALLEKAGP